MLIPKHFVGQVGNQVGDLRPTKWDENLALAISSTEGESRVHLIGVGAFPVEVEAAVEILRPSGCLIRNVHLNQ
jgi:hypothetical protein